MERDLEQADALQGYILTERSVDALRRILSGLREGTSNAWTLTSVYGTGKSAFAHYLASLCASSKSKMRSLSLEITQTALGAESNEYLALESSIPKQGHFRAVAVAQREPISNTVIRALLRGAETFWTPAKRKKIEAVSKIQKLAAEIELGNKIDSKDIPALVRELAQASKTGLLLIVNELINRRQLTSQGAKARRELIEALIEHSDLEKLGLEGYGREVTMYHSLLAETKIHREEDGYWDIYPPKEGSGV